MRRSDGRPWVLAALLVVPGVARAQDTLTGGYVVRRDTAVIATERYELAGRVLRADVELAGRGMVLETETLYDSVWAPIEYRVRVRAGAAGPVVQEMMAVLGDSVRWSVTTAGREQQGAAVLAEPRIVLQNLVQAHLAMALRRYDRGAGGRQALQAWRPEGSVVAPLFVTVTDGSVTFETGAVRLEARLDASGWIDRVEVPAQGVVAERATLPPLVRDVPAGGADTVAPAAVRELAYEFRSGRVTLRGTLTLPVGGDPGFVALLVAGSGAVDRNGNAPPVLRPNLLAQLAWRLAEQGIASVRYDKRGVGASDPVGDPAMTTLDDFAEDVRAGVESLERDPRFRGVVVVGHSEGGWLAIRAVGRGAPVRGLALLATPGRPFRDLLRHQLAQQLDSADLASFDRSFEPYLEGAALPDLPVVLRSLFQPVNRRFLESVVAFDALAELRRLDLPVLIVQGDRDVQVEVSDAERLGGAARRVSIRIVPSANHVFKSADRADRLSQLPLYADPSVPVVDEAGRALVDWVRALESDVSPAPGPGRP